jgi:hypothetical protein
LKYFDELKRGLRIVICNKSFYDENDIKKIELLITIIKEKFPERGARSTKKQLLSSKEKEVWTCECGKTNDNGSDCYGCGKDIYGFKSNEVTPPKVIAILQERISLILELLNDQDNL